MPTQLVLEIIITSCLTLSGYKPSGQPPTKVEKEKMVKCLKISGVCIRDNISRHLDPQDILTDSELGAIRHCIPKIK